MAETMAGLTGRPGTTIRWQHYSGIFLLSLATLLLELVLTRVLSVANWYHFGFLVVSTALLGFGASGVTLSLWTRVREEIPLDRALAVLSLAFSFASLASYWLMQRIPFRPFRLLLGRSQFFYTLLYYIVLAAPFFCSALAISLLLTRGSRAVNRLYAADLLGAGLGCAAVCGVTPVGKEAPALGLVGVGYERLLYRDWLRSGHDLWNDAGVHGRANYCGGVLRDGMARNTDAQTVQDQHGSNSVDLTRVA